MTRSISLAGWTEIACTGDPDTFHVGDQGAIVPMLTTHLGRPEHGPSTVNVSIETPAVSVGVAMTRAEAERLHDALSGLLDGGGNGGVLV